MVYYQNLWDSARAHNWGGSGTEVEMCWHRYPATVHFYGSTSYMEDSYCFWSQVEERMIVAEKPTYWRQEEDKPYWFVGRCYENIISFEERRYYTLFVRMEWTQGPHITSGTLQATTTSNRSFEEDRFQHWLRDVSRGPSTLKAPARDEHHLQLAHTRMKDRESHARARASETKEETDLRRKKDRERHAKRRSKLRTQGLVEIKSNRRTLLDPTEIDRRRALNRKAQQRWRDRLTANKKRELLQVRREHYYPTERRQKSNRPHH